MNVIYLSNSCSDEKFEKLREAGMRGTLPQAQKYHKLLMEGLAECIDGEVYAISTLPVNRSWTKKLFFKKEHECVGKIDYTYLSFVNYKLFRQLSISSGAKAEIKKLCKRNPDCVIVCDILNYSLSRAARKMGKKLGIPVITIVTDVPGHMVGGSGKKGLYTRLAEESFDKYDGYLLLTEAMNGIVNKAGKPYIVIEGHADSKMRDAVNSPEAKASPKVIMYAGGIRKQYGIERMAKAFVRGGFDGWELHIYGDGDYKTELAEFSKENPTVKFFGTVSNEEVVKKQLEATLLINPRPTDEDYVKYSFPSKTMECMASGTPLLTTRLPGMPPEYYDYVYFIDDESEDGVLEALKTVTERSQDELHTLGARAKEFVLREKSNLRQAKKLYDFLKGFRNK
ncbi:MAG: glycosyltransferase [Clostridia bacterium]|nr:glycosyltransferase [Clostridia bacterium]